MMDSRGCSLQGHHGFHSFLYIHTCIIIHIWAAGQPLVLNCRFKLNPGKPGVPGNVQGNDTLLVFPETFFIERGSTKLSELDRPRCILVKQHLGNAGNWLLTSSQVEQEEPAISGFMVVL